MHFHVLGSLHHVHNKNSGLPLYVLQTPCTIVSQMVTKGTIMMEKMKKTAVMDNMEELLVVVLVVLEKLKMVMFMGTRSNPHISPALRAVHDPRN